MRICGGYLLVADRQHVYILKTHKPLSVPVCTMESYIYWTWTEAIDVY